MVRTGLTQPKQTKRQPVAAASTRPANERANEPHPQHIQPIQQREPPFRPTRAAGSAGKCPLRAPRERRHDLSHDVRQADRLSRPSPAVVFGGPEFPSLAPDFPSLGPEFPSLGPELTCGRSRRRARSSPPACAARGRAPGWSPSKCSASRSPAALPAAACPGADAAPPPAGPPPPPAPAARHITRDMTWDMP
eukprot:1195827-Prorocentrum_minimum.AAC.6